MWGVFLQSSLLVLILDQIRSVVRLAVQRQSDIPKWRDFLSIRISSVVCSVFQFLLVGLLLEE